jgi:hypothetical protein
MLAARQGDALGNQLKTAAQGLDVPGSLLAFAGEVIE